MYMYIYICIYPLARPPRRPGALADMISARKVIGLITEVIRSQLI